jgi:uncharacterized protein YceH (UPF0502 family)
MELTSEAIRVLGCLVEKEATTPDNYPLSTNGLLTACNQSTSREPVVHYTERVIDQTLLDLRQEHLARTVRGDGQRVHKHKHVLDEAWRLSKSELAVLSLLMLRGAQTSAEMRQRTERYGLELDNASVEAILDRLASRDEPLVRQLPRRPGERESRWVHLLDGGHSADTAAAATAPTTPAPTTPATGDARAASADRVSRPVSASPSAPVREELDAQRAELSAQRSELDTLRAELGLLRAEVRRVLVALGEDDDAV